MSKIEFHTIQPDWKGETGFVLCGGTSVTLEDLERLRGQNVVAINSTYRSAPEAPILFFADERWWNWEMERQPELLKAFPGQVLTISRKAGKDSGILRLRRLTPPPGIATAPNTVVVERTSLQAGMNILFHRGCSRIVLVGADGRYGEGKRVHFHEEHPWGRGKNTWKVKEQQLAMTVAPLRKAGVEVLNASEISTLPWWPKVKLEEII